jgi:methylated-DNA-[protein]-cysteine S-methyltransferase
MADMRFTLIDSPVGELLLTGTDDGLSGIQFAPYRTPEGQRDDGAFAGVVTQLTEYFDGRRTTFDAALAPSGTAFQRDVWSAIAAIPYGKTVSYGSIAAKLGKPSASRAVGMATGRNPIVIIIPCHRVVGADGSLTGFGGGLERKSLLLDLEAGRPRLTPG